MPKHPSRQPGPTGPVNSTGDDIAAFRLGQQAAFEPPPDGAAGGTQVTTLVSWWNHLVCSTCGHTFRRGDPVRHLAESDDICHVAPALRCGSPAQSAPPGDRPPVPSGQRPPEAADVRDFADGLAVTWPQAGDVPVTRLGTGDWRTKRPRPPLERARCLFCAHTFRAGEYAVICPCHPASPVCGVAVHRDPGAGLTCWESWQPSGRIRQCPVTSSPSAGPVPQ